MEVHIEPTSFIIRIYEDGKSFKNRDPYALVISVNMVGPDTCYLFGMRGGVKSGWTAKVYAELKALGINKVKLERGGKNTTIDI